MEPRPPRRSSPTWAVTADRRPRGEPVEPDPSPWALGAWDAPAGEDLIAVGADLAPGTLLSAYRAGLFPMGVGPCGSEPLGWWSPDPRGVLAPGDLHVSRSMARRMGRFDIRIDTDFEAVIAGCADNARPGRWITAEMVQAYTELHRLGWAHSVEAWSAGHLAGGLYGVSIGGLFAGESMFHRTTDASKAALIGLVQHLRSASSPIDDRVDWLIDVQWRTAHLRTLGVSEMSRLDYLTAIQPLLEQTHRWPGARQSPPSQPHEGGAG